MTQNKPSRQLLHDYATVWADNNPVGLIEQIKLSGFPIVSGSKIPDLMMEIYDRSPKAYYAILHNTPYNSKARNYTVGMNFHKQLRDIIAKNESFMKHQKRRQNTVYQTSKPSGKKWFQKINPLNY